MSLYKKREEAFEKRDINLWGDSIHDDFKFVRHQSNTTMSKSEMIEMVRQMFSSDSVNIVEGRCIYENDEILVEHNLMDFADGSRESIIAVHELKDGKIIKTETGATLVKK